MRFNLPKKVKRRNSGKYSSMLLSDSSTREAAKKDEQWLQFAFVAEPQRILTSPNLKSHTC